MRYILKAIHCDSNHTFYYGGCELGSILWVNRSGAEHFGDFSMARGALNKMVIDDIRKDRVSEWKNVIETIDQVV